MILFKEIPAEVCKQCGEIYCAPYGIEMMDTVMKGFYPASISLVVFLRPDQALSDLTV